MSRRKVRLSNQLKDLAAAVEEAGTGNLETLATSVVGTIRTFLLPRLADPAPPLVVALVGSTGAGKSTLINSLAGVAISRQSVLRPTTNDPVVWTGVNHLNHPWPGHVVVGDHPLAASVALIDTPDLDSNSADNRTKAIRALAAADAVVFVTTSSRYGDASPWEVLRSVKDKSMVVVVNRLQTRASGARNDLGARLRAEGMGDVTVLTISEQRVDPKRGRLSQQSVQRLAAVVRDWAAQTSTHRVAALEAATDKVAADVQDLLEGLESRAAVAARASDLVTEAYEAGWQAIEAMSQPGAESTKRRRRTRRRLAEPITGQILEAIDGAASAAATALVREGFAVLPELMRASSLTSAELSRLGAQSSGIPARTRQIVEADRQRHLDHLRALSEGAMERLRLGAELLDDLDWRNV